MRILVTLTLESYETLADAKEFAQAAVEYGEVVSLPHGKRVSVNVVDASVTEDDSAAQGLYLGDGVFADNH